MEPEVTTKNFEVRFSDCDHHSRLKLSNLFLFMEETAIADAEQNGFGIWKMMKAGYTTVITRLKIRLLHHPVWGEKLSISTWAKDIIKDKVCLKDYSILDAQGHSIAQATSSWLLVNMKTGKAENPANAPYPIPLIPGKNALPFGGRGTVRIAGMLSSLAGRYALSVETRYQTRGRILLMIIGMEWPLRLQCSWGWFWSG